MREENENMKNKKKPMSRMDGRINSANVEEEFTIDLKELFRIFLKNLKLVLVLVVLFALGGFLISKFLIQPTYTATTSIYLTPEVSESGSLDYNSQMANSKLATNVVSLLTRNNIMTEVANNVGLESAKEVRDALTVENESNTEVITITAVSEDPQLSKNIANDTVQTFINRMQKNLNVRNIEIVDKAKLSYEPSGPNIKKNTGLGALFGLLVGIVYSFIQVLFDKRLRTKEEAEKYLGYPVFCVIPNIPNEKNN